MDVFTFVLVCIFSGLLLAYILSFMFHGRAVMFKEDTMLEKKTVLITGGTSGLGFATAQDLAARHARVIIASSNKVKGEKAAAAITEQTGNNKVEYRHLDLASLRSVRQFAQHFLDTEERLDVLVNCAGISHSQKQFTEDGYDPVFCVNYLGHFLLTYILLDLLIRSGDSRVINVSSLSHAFLAQPLDTSLMSQSELPDDTSHDTMYGYLRGYESSKLAAVLHAKALTSRLAETSVTCNAVQPNMCLSPIWHPFRDKYGACFFKIFCIVLWPFFSNAHTAAQTIIYACASQEISAVSGKYLRQCAPHWEARDARNLDLADALWDLSMRLTGCIGTKYTSNRQPANGHASRFSKELNNKLLGEKGEASLYIDIERD